jgi:LysM repeat protein
MKHIVRAGESLYSIAKQYGLTVAQLKQLNRLVSSHLRIGLELEVTGMFPSAVSDEKEKKDESKTESSEHIVIAGDTLLSISQQYQVDVAQLVDWNGLLSHNLKIGQKLKILPKNPFKISLEKKTVPTSSSGEERHVVAKGDSLYSIARKYELSVQALKEINQIHSDLLSIGQVLKIKANTNLPTEDTQSGESYKEIEANTETEDSESEIPELPVELTEAEQMKYFLEKRKIFQLEVSNGFDIFGSGLKGAVGRNHVNRPEDLEKVQTRLTQLGLLSPNHTEAPEQIRQKIGNGAITANLIPKTIEAIERFQTQYRVRFWIEHTARVAMMKTNSFTPGVILPNDITYKVLREYTQYKLSFPHPQENKPIQVKFYNFPLSPYTQYYQGVSFIGNSNPEIPVSVFHRLGINPELAKALQYVSRHEGNFDAINSYDNAVFSYGFIQFAGNGGGFPGLLANIKHKAPKVFQEYFRQFGIDVDYVLHQGNVRQAKLLVANPYDKAGKYWCEGLAAEMILREDKQLYGVFIRAGYHLPIITLQIDTAIRNYVMPALGIHLSIKVGISQLPNVAITQYISSQMALALLIDLTVNQWVLKAKEIFKQAIEEIMYHNKLRSWEELKNVDERIIIQQIISDAQARGDLRLVQRASNILQSSLSYEKSKQSVWLE